MGLPWWLRGQSVCLQCRRSRFDPWVGKIPWRRKWQPSPVFLPVKSHGQRMWVQSLAWENALEKGMATHSSILDWRIPWTEEPCGLQSMGSWKVGHDWAANTHKYINERWCTHQSTFNPVLSPTTKKGASPNNMIFKPISILLCCRGQNI